jgi:NADP-dependent 3-hydroxy acid dehydrogenase YdfG
MNSTYHSSNVLLLQGVAICDVNTEVGQQRLQELTEKYGQGRVIFIQVDVRNYQQFEGDRNLLWRAQKVTINTFIMFI